MFRSLALSLLLALPGAALAATGPEVLSTVDTNANATTDFTASVSAKTTAPGKTDKDMAFQLYTAKGKRMVAFSAPGDMKGTRVLVLNRTQMYVWLPAYNKVRRIASHVSDQGFMGTSFSDADMSTSVFGEVYDATLNTEDAETWTLSMPRKEGEKSPYARLEMVVRKDIGLPSEIRYFSDKGQHVKTETRADYSCEESACIPGTLTMVDHSRGGLSTTLTQTVESINAGLSDDVFSQRTLQRGL